MSLKLKKVLTAAISLLAISISAGPCAQESSESFTALLESTKEQTQTQASKTRTAEALTSIVAGTYPNQSDWHLLGSLHKQHPRLIITDQDIATINGTIQKDPIAQKLFHVLKERAEEMLGAEPPKYSTNQEGALTQSRLALKHLTTFAAMYLLTHDIRFAKHARDEMLEIAAFPDWGPANFLDVAEMTASMAIGYDWLFDQLTDGERQTIREAIVTRGLDPGLAQYKGDGWWRLANSNWNFVCNGGLTMGALAIAESEPVRAEKIIACAALSSPYALKSLDPDGGWSEGPMYWTYGTRYLTYFLSSLQSALGTDFGFSKSTGLSETGFFRIYTESPTGECFNFADSETEVGRGAQMFWFSQKYKQPVFAGAELHIAEIFPEMFHLLFYTSDHITPDQARLPLSKLFKSVDVACLRSSWTDPNGLYVGFKGGDNSSHHAHLDLGTFVFDADGLRWAEDLGPEDYELPGYFREKRWDYYRTRTEGHNTLTSNLVNQNLKAKAHIIRFSADAEQPFAVADISDGYKGIFSSAKRGVKLFGKDGILIQDEVQAPGIVPLEWHFHTSANVHLTDNGQTAVLTQTGKNGAVTMFAEIISPKDGVFSPRKALAALPQIQKSITTDLIIPLKLKTGRNRILVRISRRLQGLTAMRELNDW